MHHFKTEIMLKRLSARDLPTVLLTAGLLIIFFLPTEFLFHNPTSFCIHKNLLNFDCPACGMTRALNCLLHGQFRQAFIFNIGIAPLTLLIVQHYSSYITPANFTYNFRKISVWLLATTLLTQYILKTVQHFT
jgi:hypothetical protein